MSRQPHLFHNGKVFWSHIRVLLSSSAVAVTAVVVWLIVRRTGFWVPEREASYFENFLIPFLGSFHGFLASFVVYRTWEESRDMLHAVRAGDEKTFQLLAFDRIPKIVHFLLAAMSLIIIASTIVLHYDSMFGGIFTVGAPAFVLALYWQVATVLDDPSCSPLLVGRIPDAWVERVVGGKDPEDLPK